MYGNVLDVYKGIGICNNCKDDKRACKIYEDRDDYNSIFIAQDVKWNFRLLSDITKDMIVSSINNEGDNLECVLKELLEERLDYKLEDFDISFEPGINNQIMLVLCNYNNDNSVTTISTKNFVEVKSKGFEIDLSCIEIVTTK